MAPGRLCAAYNNVQVEEECSGAPAGAGMPRRGGAAALRPARSAAAQRRTREGPMLQQ